MKKIFEEGKTYYGRSVCDYDCIWEFEVIKRTPKTLIVKEVEASKMNPTKERKCKIYYDENNEEEYIKPLGTYSMCLHVLAHNVVNEGE